MSKLEEFRKKNHYSCQDMADKLSKGTQDENVLKLENIDRNKTLEEFSKFKNKTDKTIY